MAAVENANNLGAPASGFGQDVSFAFKPGGVPDQRSLGGAAPVVGGVDSNPGYQAQDHTIVAPKSPADNTYGMLLDVGAKILEPKMKEARAKAFISGMQRAAQGEAVTDIVESQPWFSRIFGDSDAVAGARAYAGHAQAAAAGAALEDQMPALRAMSPEQASTVFNKTVADNLTGDATTDMQIMSSMTNQLPAIMRRQAKEHYAWQQGQAAQAEQKSMMAGAMALQKAAAGTVYESEDGQILSGVVKPEEFAAQAQAWVQSIRPSNGRDAVNWQITTTKTLNDMANNGYFHALNAFKSAGGFDALTEDQVAKINTKWESEEKSQRALNSGPYMAKIVDIRASMKYGTDGRTMSDYSKLMDDVNSAYTATTGSRLGLFTPEEKISLLTQGVEQVRANQLKAVDAAKAREDKLDGAAAKAEAHAGTIREMAGYFKQGNLSPSANAADQKEAWAYLRSTDPQAYVPALVETFYSSNHATDKTLEGQMRGAVQASISTADPTSIMTMYQSYWLPLYTKGTGQGSDGATAADAYMGDFGKKMRIFHDTLNQGGADPKAQAAFAAQALQNAFVLPNKMAKIADGNKHDQALLSSTRKAVSTKLPEWWGSGTINGNISLRADQANKLASLVKKDVQNRMIDEHDTDIASASALSNLRRTQNLQVLGGYFWLDPSNSESLPKVLDKDVPPDHVAAALRDALDEKYTAQGVSADQVTLTRAPGPGANFAAFITSKDGSDHVVTLTQEEIVASYKSKREAAKVVKASVGTGFTTPGNSSNDIIRPNLVGSNPRANAPN